MDIKQLEYFISIAKHNNFTAAAQEFYVSQPSVSHQIKNLEQELNTELLRRNTRRVELTEAGEIFLEDARRIISILENSKRKIHHNREKLLEVRIGYLASPTKNFLPQILSIFHEKHPDVKVRLSHKNATQIINDARNDVCDIYCSLTEDMKQVPGLCVKSIQTDHYCLVTPKDHPVLQQMMIDYSKLANEPFIVMKPTLAATMYRQILEICQQLGFSPRIIKTCDLYEEILYSIESGIGVSIMPYRTKGYMNNNLAYTLLDASQLSISTSLAWKEDSENLAVELFLDVCKTYIQEHPDDFL